MITLDNYKAKMLGSIQGISDAPKSLTVNGSIIIDGERNVCATKVVLDALSNAELTLVDALYVLERAQTIIQNQTTLDSQYVHLSSSAEAVAV